MPSALCIVAALRPSPSASGSDSVAWHGRGSCMPAALSAPQAHLSCSLVRRHRRSTCLHTPQLMRHEHHHQPLTDSVDCLCCSLILLSTPDVLSRVLQVPFSSPSFWRGLHFPVQKHLGDSLHGFAYTLSPADTRLSPQHWLGAAGCNSRAGLGFTLAQADYELGHGGHDRDQGVLRRRTLARAHAHT